MKRAIGLRWILLVGLFMLWMPAFAALAADTDVPAADASGTDASDTAAPDAADPQEAASEEAVEVEPEPAAPVPESTGTSDLDIQKAQLELEKAKAEAEKAKWEAEKAQAEAKRDSKRDIQKNNNFTINPLGLIIGGLGITYTRGFADVASLGFMLAYAPPLILPGHVIGGGLELYFWPRHPNNGFFIGPYAQISRTIATDDDYLGVTTVAPGAMLGWRWIWHNGFNLGLGGGFGWAFAVDQEPCPSGAMCMLVGDGPAPRLQFDLGYAF